MSENMSKARNIVICSDGTGNAGGRGRGSNVWRIRQAVDRSAKTSDKRPKQVVLYEDGVGTQALKPARIAGLAFGFGMRKDLRNLYGRLIREFDIHSDESGNPDPDHLYLFGFSRGAFTIRVFANMLHECGIADAFRTIKDKGHSIRERKTPEEIDALARKALDAYAKRIRDPKAPERFRLEFGRKWKPDLPNVSDHELEKLSQGRFPIRFVGVWDTVDAVGLPFDGLTQKITGWGTYGFRMNLRRSPAKDFTKWKDDDLHGWIENAYHAMAVDDERHTFHPVLFQEYGGNGKRKADNPTITGRSRTIEQVWFAGMHSNVGGGYPKDQMAYVSLHWMMMHANHHGLEFDPERWNEYKQELDEFGKMYDSRSGTGSFYRYKPRRIEELSGVVGLNATGTENKPRIHASVLRRIAYGTRDYAPPYIPPAGKYVQVDTPAAQEKGPNEAQSRKEASLKTFVYEQRKDCGKETESAQPGQESPFIEETAAYIHDKNIRADAQTLTDGLVSVRRGLFYGLYLWIFALIGTGLWLKTRDHARGLWLDSHGNEYSWLVYALGTGLLGLLGWIASHYWRPVKGNNVGLTARYRIARTVAGTGLVATLLILFKGLLADILIGMVPGPMSGFLVGIGNSLLAFTLAGVTFFWLLHAVATTKHRIRELNVSAWLRALGRKAEHHRDSVWARLAMVTQWAPCRGVARVFEKVLAPGVAVLLILAAFIVACSIAFKSALVSSNVHPWSQAASDQADGSASETRELVSLHQVDSRSVKRTFHTRTILSTGVELKEGWTYKVTAVLNKDKPWMDRTIKVESSDGLKPKQVTPFMKVGKFRARLPSAPYFHLIGTIGDPAGKPFIVKSGQPFTANVSGEMFLFVNDVPGFYRNNSGESTVTIELVGEEKAPPNQPPANEES